MTFVDLKNGKQTSNFPSNTILCLGNFDGVHKGHRSLLSVALDEKTKLISQYPDILAGIWLFRLSPLHYLQNDYKSITEIDRKLQIFKSLSLDFAILADFPQLRYISPFDFVHDILEDKCKCKTAICGFNYNFAKDGLGDARFLKDNFSGKTIICPPITENGVPVSSTLIRSLIKGGMIEHANDLLNEPFTITAIVEHGAKLGSALGFPTINQAFSQNLIIPHFGVYASHCIIENKAYNSITNVGKRPTVSDNEQIYAETFIFDFSGDLYGKKVDVQLLNFMRKECKFDSITTLKNTVLNDIETAKRILVK